MDWFLKITFGILGLCLTGLMVAAVWVAMTPRVQSGVVVEKGVQEAWMQPVGDTFIFHPRRLVLTIQGDDEYGTTRETDWEVSQEAFSRYRVGDRFDANP
jgi:hypothetical protein